MHKLSFPVFALAFGHMVTDMQAGALPIVLPQLKDAFSLSYSQLAFIILLQNLMSSVIQPAFGYITDRRSLPRLLPICAAAAIAGFATIGWVPTYGLLLLNVILLGLASATFHPQASKTTNFLSDDGNRTSNMGIFSIGGNLGLAAGSVSMAFLLGLDGGIHNTLYMALPAIVAFLLVQKGMDSFIRVNREHELNRKQVQKESAGAPLPITALCLILFYIFMRSSIHSGISTYLPIFFIKFRDFSTAAAGSLVTAFLMGGVIGTYIGAILSDRLGAKKILLGSILLSIPGIGLITIASSQFMALVAVFTAGFCLIGSFATTTIFVQSLMPDNVGMASGLAIGLSVGMGGFGVTILGFLADHFGLPFVMNLLVWLPAAAALAVIRISIPENLKRKAAKTAEAEKI